MLCKRKLVVLCFLHSWIKCVLSSEKESLRDKKVSETWSKIKQAYNPLMRPNFTGNVTDVIVSLTILQFDSVNDKDKSFKTDMYFRQRWVDYRAQHNLTTVLTPGFGKNHPSTYIWVPDTVFRVMTGGYIHSNSTASHKVDIYPNGTISWGCRVTLMSHCTFDLHNYPMDTQQCEIGVLSFAHDKTHINYVWGEDNPVSLILNHLPQHSVHIKNATNLSEYYSFSSNKEGEYSLLKFDVIFERRFQAYIFQAFFPSASLVMVSWVSFWLHINCVSARLGIGIVSLLTTYRLWEVVINAMPKINYTTALDIYMLGCTTFICLSLLEYGLATNIHFTLWKEQKANYTWQTMKKKQETRKSIDFTNVTNLRTKNASNQMKQIYDAKQINDTDLVLFDNLGRVQSIRKTSIREQKLKLKEEYLSMWKSDPLGNRPYYFEPMMVTGKPASLDIVSRFLFPFGFLCFNIIYWASFL
ncbi:gamma-aminobutyric acid receptor subunit pi isoform X5 [Hydra vulgaris]|uniref:Gamma-aminobutyric acid receptor subunit pi isoform X5 n=2 Tax=Hydra vulgaris TaxID=6087 RepID=A0ABM4B3Q9_HYDVU